MKKKNHAIGGVVAFLGAASVAHAVPVQLSQTVSLGELLQNNSTSVQFDLTTLLLNGGFNPQDVQSGTLVVYGLSDPSYQTTANPYGAYFVSSQSQRTVQYSYTYYSGGCYYSSWGGGYCYYYPVTGYSSYYVVDQNLLRQRDISHVDNVADVMTVTAGGSSASDTADQVANSTGSYGNTNYEGSGGDYYNGYRYYYNQQRDVYESISGPLSVSMELDGDALQDLGQDGLLGIGVSAIGQLSLRSARLDIWAEAPPVVTVESRNGVPEPGTLALGGAALGALALARRRRVKKG